MQNSPAVAARAIVMLACLILIPLVALFGSSSPELLARLLDGRNGSEANDSDNAISEAPPFCPEEEAPALSAGTRTHDPRVRPAQAGGAMAAEVAARYDAPMATAGPENFDLRPGDPRVSDPGGARATSTVALPGDGRGPTDLVGGAVSQPGSGAIQPQRFPPVADQVAPLGTPTRGSVEPLPAEGGTFESIQERLRDMGAVYYRLESWGSQQQLYRFQCEVAVKGSPGLTRHFEAVDRQALMAMHKVLVEAAAWHASR